MTATPVFNLTAFMPTGRKISKSSTRHFKYVVVSTETASSVQARLTEEALLLSGLSDLASGEGDDATAAAYNVQYDAVVERITRLRSVSWTVETWSTTLSGAAKAALALTRKGFRAEVLPTKEVTK